MTMAEFQTQMDRLASQFSKTAYSAERAKLIWLAVQDLPAGWMRSVTDRFLGEFRQAPLLPDFREEIGKLRERTRTQPRHEEVQGDGPKVFRYACEFCKDSGVYLCKKKEAEGMWGFRCHCPLGEKDERVHIPQFKQMHAEQGYYWEAVPRRA